VRTPTLPNQRRKSLRSLRLPFIALLAVLLLMGALLLAAPAPAKACAVSYESEETEFVRLLNDYRVANGAQPLQLCDMITEACDRHNSDMIKYNFFDHVTVASDWFSAGANHRQRMAASGYSCATAYGENLAFGDDIGLAAEVFAAWQGSTEGHNEMMLNPDMKVLGVSCTFDADPSNPGWYWTTDFGNVVWTPPPPAPTTFVDTILPPHGGDVYRWRGRVAVFAEAYSYTERIRKVEFYVDGTRIGTDYRRPFKKTWNARRVVSGSMHWVTTVAYNPWGVKIGEDTNYVRVW
jgi:uncharacterized protein YkwD